MALTVKDVSFAPPAPSPPETAEMEPLGAAGAGKVPKSQGGQR